MFYWKEWVYKYILLKEWVNKYILLKEWVNKYILLEGMGKEIYFIGKNG